MTSITDFLEEAARLTIEKYNTLSDKEKERYAEAITIVERVQAKSTEQLEAYRLHKEQEANGTRQYGSSLICGVESLEKAIRDNVYKSVNPFDRVVAIARHLKIEIRGGK